MKHETRRIISRLLLTTLLCTRGYIFVLVLYVSNACIHSLLLNMGSVFS